MQYRYYDYEQMLHFCESIFRAYGFDAQKSAEIADVVLMADLNGTESHGVQRMVRYAREIGSGMVNVQAEPEVVHETPISAVVDAHDGMGQVMGQYAMRMAIDKARVHGVGMVEVRNSNHYGIAGYYAEMAAKEDMMGISMTNTEEIMVPTNG